MLLTQHRYPYTLDLPYQDYKTTGICIYHHAYKAAYILIIIHVGEYDHWSLALMSQWISHIHNHDDVIKWKHFPRYWPFVRGIHRSPVNSPHKGQWRGVLMFTLIWVWINDWVNNREAGDLRSHRAHCDVIVMRNKHEMSQSHDYPINNKAILEDISKHFSLIHQ